MIKFLVIGDGCTDVHIYGKCNRLSPEAPVPILNPIKNAQTTFLRPEHKHHSDFDEIVSLGDDCLLHA